MSSRMPDNATVPDDLELLAQVSQLLTSHDVDETLGLVVNLAAQICRAQLASLIVSKGDGYHYISDITPASQELVMTLVERGLAGWVIRNREGVIIDDTYNDPRWHKTANNSHARSAISIPLLVRDEVIGALSLSHTEPEHFTEYHLRLLTILGNQAAVAIRNAFTLEALKNQQELLRTILQAVPDDLLVISVTGKVLLMSDATRELIAPCAFDDPTDISIYALADCEGAFVPVAEMIANNGIGENPFETRSEYHNRDYLTHVSAWQLPDQSERGYVVVMKDITPLRNMARFKDQTIRLIAHDLRSPLAVVYGYAHIVAEDLENVSGTKDIQGYMQMILSISQSMDEVLSSLLDMERTRMSQAYAELVNPYFEASKAYESQLQAAQMKKLTLQFLVNETDSELQVKGDPYLLERSMSNLISNAIKYTPEGGNVRVTLTREGDQVLFVVEDNGIGISQQDIPRLFEPFFRGSNSGGLAKGTGLGLCLVKEIIEQHNGVVGVESVLNKGSRFWFRLPLV